MSRARAPGASQELASRVVRHLLGSGDLRVIAGVVALLVGLGWFTDSLFEWLTDFGTWLGGGTVTTWWPVHRVLAVGFFVLELLALALLARGARKRYRPRVATDPEPTPVRGLILFLSNLRRSDADELAAGLTAIADLDGFRARFGALNWRMPLEAIAYHRARLHEVTLICSRDETGSDGTSVPGSAAQWPLFRDLAGRLFPQAAFTLRDAAHLDSRYTGGVPFEDVDRVSQVTDDAFADLLRRGLPTSEILIDVTGGQKPNAVAATAVALAEGRRIQYVARDCRTGLYRVKVYDVTYEPESAVSTRP